MIPPIQPLKALLGACHLALPVVLRVDGDEDDIERVVAGRLAPQLHQPLKCGRADVAAAGEAEIDRVGLAFETAARKRLSIRTDERERPANACFALRRLR